MVVYNLAQKRAQKNTELCQLVASVVDDFSAKSMDFVFVLTKLKTKRDMQQLVYEMRLIDDRVIFAFAHTRESLGLLLRFPRCHVIVTKKALLKHYEGALTGIRSRVVTL